MRRRNIGIGLGVALVAVAGFMYWRTPPSLTPAVKQIRVLAEDSSNIKAISELVPEFTDKTGIQVNIEAVDFATTEARANTDLSQGTGRYDIVLQYNFSLQPYIEKEYVDTLRELTPYKSGDLDWQFEV